MPTDLKHTALLVVDMQNNFDSIAGHLVERLIPLIEAFQSRNLPVFFTQHGHLPNDRGTLVRKWGPPGKGSILRGSKTWELLSGLASYASDPISRIDDKSQYDSFLGTQLESRLRERGVTNVIISGTMTNLCCETTARSAFCRNFDVLMLDDGCATSGDAMHNASLKNFEFGFGEVCNVADLLKHLKSEKQL